MSTINAHTRHKTQQFGRKYQPDSKIDMVNITQNRQANKEVVAFLEWLDQRK